MKIAICGTRGIPARYGGFETFAEELAVRLVEKGHSVTVYGRPHAAENVGATYRGVKLCLLPAVRQKYLETPLHTLICFVHAVFHPVDVMLVCNGANSPFLWIPRLVGIPCVVNVDGIERLRGKWNRLGKWWYRFGEICSVLFASIVVSDAEVIRKYYFETYRRNSTVIPYGFRQGEERRVEAKVGLTPSQSGFTPSTPSSLNYTDSETELFKELGIEPGRYILYVSRLEPENNAHVVIEAYQRASDSVRRFPLVIVGDAPYAREYIDSLHKMAGPGVVFAGFRFGSPYVTLQVAARLYIQATEVGGTHPALVEAMGYGNAIIGNGTPENVEVIGDGGVIYPKNDVASLSRELESLVENEERLLELRRAAFRASRSRFLWESIVASYQDLFRSLVVRPNG